MARELLGETFDINGGGIDLLFPHHENEVAQSTCAGHGFARVWMHNEMLQVEGKKMSKSLGNFFTVRDLLDQGVPGEVIRFVFLSTHYRKPMDWTEKKRAEAEKTLRKWYSQAAQAQPGGVAEPNFVDLLADDLNTHAALAECHQYSHAHDVVALRAGLELLGLMGAGVPAWAEQATADLSSAEAHLQAVRTEAMQTKDFAEVDRIKAALLALGVEVRMSKEGVSLSAPPGFDASALEDVL